MADFRKWSEKYPERYEELSAAQENGEKVQMWNPERKKWTDGEWNFNHRELPEGGYRLYEMSNDPPKGVRPVQTQERKRAPLDWNKPAGPFDPFKGFFAGGKVYHSEIAMPKMQDGPLSRTTGSDDYGRSTFVNPLLRG